MTLKIEAFVISPIGSNCYVLYDDETREAVIVDPGDTALGPVFSFIEDEALTVQAIWATHGHFDHVMGVDVVREKYRVQAWVHEADAPLWAGVAEVTMKWLHRSVPSLAAPDLFWKDGDVVVLASHVFQVLHTPGHSPGSVCLVHQNIAITGDTLFAGSIGRTDLPLSDGQAMQLSLIRLLATLADSVALYPGHAGDSTMGIERQSNPYLQLND